MSYSQFKNITIQQLEILIELVEAGSFTQAARRIYLSQPTLTKHIKNLEEMIEFPVVIRTRGGVSLTPEGRILYDHARRICRLRDDAHDKILKLKDQDRGDIFVCASNIPSTYILPRLLGGFQKLYPRIRIQIQVGDSEEALQMVLTGQSEIGFVGKEPHEKRLNVEPLWTDQLVLAAPADHEWQKVPAITLTELAKVPFIIRERGSGTRETLDIYLQKNAGVNLSDFTVVCEMGSSEAVKEAVIAGVGVSILSDQAVAREREEGIIAVIPIRDFHIERNFYLIYKKQFNLMAYHRRFLDFVRKNRNGEGSKR
ncbi:MAG: LysR family transcriptional regulator [Deltaproteobacteria bacterium]|nr:LysR family transcriptional regulator [Deltaproteobacteria bacterium]